MTCKHLKFQARLEARTNPDWKTLSFNWLPSRLDKAYNTLWGCCESRNTLLVFVAFWHYILKHEKYYPLKYIEYINFQLHSHCKQRYCSKFKFIFSFNALLSFYMCKACYLYNYNALPALYHERRSMWNQPTGYKGYKSAAGYNACKEATFQDRAS